MAGGPGSDSLFEGETSVDSSEISSVVGLLLQLEQLANQGMSPDQVAAVMADTDHAVPGGGSWDADAVLRISGVVDSVRNGNASPPPAAAPLPLATRQEVPVSPPQYERQASGAFVARDLAPPTDGDTGYDRDFASGAGWTAQEHLAADPRFDGEFTEAYDDDYEAQERERFRRMAFALGALGLTTAGLLAFAAIRWSGDDAADQVASEPLNSQSAEPSIPEGLSPPPTENVDPADMMSIRVEPEPPEGDDVVVDSSVEAATATVKADGLLHLEGAFPNQEEADRYIAGVGKVFGEDNIVESYVINAAAPLPSVSDVALDKPVLFETGTATIDPSYIPFLEACGDVLRLNPHITMSIAAFTDSTGSDEVNLALSQKRAQAIYDFYRDLDIDDSQLLSFGYGEANPVADNGSDAGRAQNRRAMLQLLDVMAEESAESDG